MSKAKLIADIADKFDSRAAAERAVDAVFEGIERVVRGGDPVHIRGFGSFVAKERAAREGRNPATGEPVSIRAKRVLGFRSKLEL